MAAAFLAGEGIGPGGSPVDPVAREQARVITQKAASLGVLVLLPRDVVIARGLRADPSARTVPVQQVPIGCVIVDIGPLTIAEFTRELRLCRTVIWNGPMGLFEIGQYAGGTRAIATTLADLDATTVVGGGSTAEAVTNLGLSNRMSHVSTGGGASLQFLAGKVLPGLAVIPDR
jgi:phosphoglycerate kinase